MGIIFPVPAHAEQNARKKSERSVEVEMSKGLTGAQKDALFIILNDAMGIFRDDKPFIFDATSFGVVEQIDSASGEYWMKYSYNTGSISTATIQITTTPDPLDLSDDRSSVPVVPNSFTLQFFSMADGVERQELEKRLSLETYWIDGEGERHDGNSLPSFPPLLRQHVYRYRAKTLATSRFPVDVEFFYFDPKRGDENREPSLHAIRIARDYPYFTPEMRKRKREEEQHRLRD